MTTLLPMQNSLSNNLSDDISPTSIQNPALNLVSNDKKTDPSDVQLHLPLDNLDLKTTNNHDNFLSKSPNKTSAFLEPPTPTLLVAMKNSSETFEFDGTSRYSEDTPKEFVFQDRLSKIKSAWDDHNNSGNQDSFLSADGALLARASSFKVSSSQLGKRNYMALESPRSDDRNTNENRILGNIVDGNNSCEGKQFRSIYRFGEKSQIEELKSETEGSPGRRPHGHIALNIQGNQHIALESLEEETQRESTRTQGNNSIMTSGNIQQQQQQASAPAQRTGSRTGSLVGPGVEEVLPEIESKLYLKRSVLNFTTGATLSIISFLVIFEKIDSQWLFAVIYGYLVLNLIQNLQRIRTEGRDAWRVLEDKFAVGDNLKWAVYIAGIHLHTLGWAFFSNWNILPFGLLTLLYFAFSKAPAITRNIRTLLRLLFTLQILLLTLRVNDTMQSDWIFVFSILWLYIGIIAIYLIAYTAILLLSFIFLVFQIIFKQPIDDRHELKIQFKGLFWHFLYYGLGVATSFVIIGVNDVYSLQVGSRSLIQGLSMTLIITVILAIYSVVSFKDLVFYIKLYSLTDGALLGSDTFTDNQNSTRDKKDEKITIEIEKKESYFVMLSSTYFKPLNAGLLGKNEERIKKLKEMIKVFRSGKFKQQSQSNKPRGSIDIEALKQDKQALDKKFDCFDEQKFVKRSNKGGPLRMTALVQSPDVRANQMSPPKQNARERHHLSVGDLDGVMRWQPEQEGQNQDKEEEVCYLCCVNAPTAVLMTCGHGGICYDCGVKLMSQKNECMQCRQPVTEIYKVDPNPHMKDVIKGIELCKVIKGKKSSKK